MEWITLAWKFRSEIGIAICAVAIVLLVLDIRSTYHLVDRQEQEIKALQGGLENAKNAVRLQADVQLAMGRIDERTYRNISAALNRPVPRVLVPAGVLR